MFSRFGLNLVNGLTDYGLSIYKSAKLVNSLVKTTNQTGQTLIEALLAIAVAIIVVVGLVGMAVVSMRSANYSKNQAEAVRLARSQLELLRNMRDTSWSDFSLNLTGNSCGTTGCCVTTVITTYSPAACTVNNTFDVKFTSSPVIIVDEVTINTVVTFSEGAVVRTVPLTETFTNWR